MNKYLLVFVVLLMSSVSFAQEITLSQDADKFNGIQLSTKATVDGVELTQIAFGLRKKAVGPFPVKVYTMQVFVSDPASVSVGEELIESIYSQESVMVVLDFVRNVTADQVFTAFGDAFAANNVDKQVGAVKEFLATVKNGGDARKKQQMIFYIDNSDKTTVVTYVDPKGAKTQTVGVTLGTDILDMWYGKILSTDKGLQDLKAELIKE